LFNLFKGQTIRSTGFRNSNKFYRPSRISSPSEKLAVVGNIRTLPSSVTYSAELYTYADAVSDPNGNEAASNANWNIAYSGGATVITGGSAAGSYHLYKSGGNGGGMGHLLPVSAGKQYRVTVSVKVDDGAVKVGIWPESERQKISNGDPYGVFVTSNNVGVTDWVTKTYDFTATENTMVFGTRTLSSSIHRIDNLSLKEIINTGDILANDGYFSGNINAGGTGTSYFGGNVGIGTTAPGEKLEVNGTIKATDIEITSTWHDFLVPSGWTSNDAKCRKVDGWIELRGRMSKAIPAGWPSETPLFLPVACRPQTSRYTATFAHTSVNPKNGVTNMDWNADGTVGIYTDYALSQLRFDGIRFWGEAN